ncbi:MAG TPA: hypothetical protein PK925_13865 [Alicycliphilus sp.]|nr:hypothetical protein [Alicycliphilus sp.]
MRNSISCAKVNKRFDLITRSGAQVACATTLLREHGAVSGPGVITHAPEPTPWREEVISHETETFLAAMGSIYSMAARLARGPYVHGNVARHGDGYGHGQPQLYSCNHFAGR